MYATTPAWMLGGGLGGGIGGYGGHGGLSGGAGGLGGKGGTGGGETGGDGARRAALSVIVLWKPPFAPGNVPAVDICVFADEYIRD